MLSRHQKHHDETRPTQGPAHRELDSPLALPELEICERCEKIFTAAVNAVLRENMLTRQIHPDGIRPLRDHQRVAGFAVTIKGGKNLESKNEMAQRAEMLDSLKEDSFVVWIPATTTSPRSGSSA